MDSGLKSWLISYTKFDWKTSFKFLLSPRTIKAIEGDDNGLANFVRGFYYEFEENNYIKALECYTRGAELLDSLCIFRLHEIYLGDINFKIDLEEMKSLCYLVFGCLINQFETFEKYSFWTKLDAFVKKNKENKVIITDILSNPPVEYFQWVSPLYSKIFTFIFEKSGYSQILPEFKQLPFEMVKKSYFNILNGLFDFLAYAYNGDQPHSELRDFLVYLLDITISDLPFDDLFETFITHLKLAKTSKVFAQIFSRRIESNGFWVWTFSFQSSLKNHYLASLLRYEDILLDGTIELKMNTCSWINNYIGYCYEKGLGTSKNFDRALELYEKDISQMQRILFSRFRKIVSLKHINQDQDTRNLINEVKEIVEDRMKDSSRMDCYLFYVSGKVAEKIDENLDQAIEWYEKGVNSDTYSCLKYHLLANETWRGRCAKRLTKLKQKKGIEVEIRSRRED